MTTNYSTRQPPPIIYALCCTSRSGSTYLCELLASSGVLGRPEEYLNTAALPRWRSRLKVPGDAPLGEYVDRLLEACTTAGAFGVKTVPEALARLESVVRPTHFIWLRRRDVLRQAISLYRASHSGVWQRRGAPPAGEASPHASSPPQPAVPFDRQAITQVRGWIEGANVHWAERFAVEPRPVLPLWYESVCEHPQATVEQIARFLDQPLPEGIVAAATTSVMRDELTEQWARRLAA